MRWICHSRGSLGLGKCLVEVSHNSAATLETQISKHILPGSPIVSDGWVSYSRNIPKMVQ